MLLNQVVITRNVTFNEKLFFGFKKEEREILNVREINRIVKYVNLTKGTRKPLLIINLINKFLIINLSPNLLNKPKKGELQNSKKPLKLNSGVKLPRSPKDCKLVNKPLTLT